MNVMTQARELRAHDLAAIAESTSANCLASRVRQLSRIVTRAYDDALRPFKITASQFTLLTQLAQQDGITAVEIGGSLDIEKSTLSRNLARLQKEALITMDPPAGRRGRGLHLTPRGQAVIKEAYPVWQETQQRAISLLGSDSRGTLDGLVHDAERLASH